MAITILPPAPAVLTYQAEDSPDDSDDGGVDLDGDSEMRPAKRARRVSDIVTPGETVTDDPQWMRYALFLLRHLVTLTSTDDAIEATELSLLLLVRTS
jgi:hypothetical protein